MRKKPDLIDQVTQSLTAVHEQRKHPRTSFQEKLVARIQCKGRKPFNGKIRDISHGGIGVVATRPLEPGELFSLYMKFPNGLLRLECSTARCIRNTGRARFIIGARIVDFTREDPIPEVVDFDHVAEVQKRLEEILGVPL